jgi:hypothetical protein
MPGPSGSSDGFTPNQWIQEPAMRELRVRCPQCKKWCEVNLDEGDLTEGGTSEGFECLNKRAE